MPANSQYVIRRQRLMDSLPEDSFVILVGYQQKVRSKNIKYHFRQDNDFLYLTGFNEPDAVALLYRGPQGEINYTLLCRPKDPQQEVSFGARAGITGALEHFGANQAFDIAELENVIAASLTHQTEVYISDELGRFNHQLLAWCNAQRHGSAFDTPKCFRSITPLAKHLHPLRVIKDESEQAAIRAAVNASIDGHKAVMTACRSGINEAQLAATFNFAIAAHGANEVAYPNIVAAGDNACCLHYEENCCQLQSGQMLLIDAGAELNHYAADITRSYPVDGRFTQAQEAIYQLVLDALDAAIAKVKPGTPWNHLYETCMQVMARGLVELGLLQGSYEEVMASESYKRFTVHKTGHWLGMDVHDVGPYHNEDGEWRKLEPGMIFTIEPGIYIPTSATDVPEAYRGMGIRIEDDILVTADGHENLSEKVPRSIAEIEAFMGRS
ncbi:aminopeptidase P N-terminal domain-containing protein [Shewanella alkalitolerans]|uniref:aminopeptidase P N-terminal domain-containing protein n=1 Tax=Shewanella alkalitolerans TaxID=2864209 RepID=UPI001C65BA2B|nr:aminopeptidase P N-terminal domain-containing protein [Shewanella alkalitolerans]QYJ96299.1 aminopeptidase P N-terminal domain-containing protein [Shewanella alkalitolerans]